MPCLIKPFSSPPENVSQEFKKFLEFARCKTELPAFSFLDFQAIAAMHLQMFKASLSLSKMISLLGINAEKAAALMAQQTALEEARTQVGNTHDAHLANLVPSYLVPQFLGITRLQYRKWSANDRLKAAAHQSIEKWGKTLQVPFFDSAYLQTITPEVMASWEEEDLEAAKTNRVQRSKTRAESIKPDKPARAKNIKGTFCLEKYHLQFDVARSIKRKINLYLGPANSDRTNCAVECLLKAKSGIYLAPFRTQALQMYARMKDAGLAVNLITEEDQIFEVAARHTCATIERCDFDVIADVAVIDGIDMIDDELRGWAWTAALLGAPARLVYACGPVHTQAAMRSLLGGNGTGSTDDPGSILTTFFERQGSVTVESQIAGLDDIEHGDALIVSSQADVLSCASLLRHRGLKVSVLCAEFSSDVRLKQAQLFMSGQTQVVVATNSVIEEAGLSIRRVVFKQTRKIDGSIVFSLPSSRVKDISELAGIHSSHVQGLVSAFELGDLMRIKRIMELGMLGAPAAISLCFSIRPTWLQVVHTMTATGLVKVSEVLSALGRTVLEEKYKHSSLTQMLARAHFVENGLSSTLLPLSASAVFKLACAPIDLSIDSDRFVFDLAIEALRHSAMMELPEFDRNADTPSQGTVKFADIEFAQARARRLTFFSWAGLAFPGLVEMASLDLYRVKLNDAAQDMLDAYAGSGDVGGEARPAFRKVFKK